MTRNEVLNDFNPLQEAPWWMPVVGFVLALLMILGLVLLIVS